MKQKSQNLGLLLLPGLDWLTLRSLHFLQACVFFFQVFWSKFATLLKFFSNKTTNKNQPLLNFTFYHVFIPSVTFVLHLTFSSLSKSFHCFLSLFLSFLFFVFDIRLSFLSICFGYKFNFFKYLCNVFNKLLIFREIFTP